MLQFLRLTSRVINKAHIIEITKPSLDKYSIYMSNTHISGFAVLGGGSISSTQNVIEICKVQNPHDYDCISKFIQTI
jgi:hypothetical protein